MTKIAQVAPMGRKYRVSSEGAFPLRGVDGKTYAERRAEQEKAKSK